jgi:hypothetical protein
MALPSRPSCPQTGGRRQRPPTERRGARRWLHGAAAVAAVLALAAGSASAAVATGIEARPGKGRTQPALPSGQLATSGTGAIIIQGQVTAVGSIQGRAGGQLVVQDLFGDAVVSVNGGRQRGRRVNVRNVKGSFYVKGRRVMVRLVAPSMTASIAGRGRVTLNGVGTYDLNGTGEQSWPEGAFQLELLPPQPTN